MDLNEYPMPPLRPEVDRDGYGRYMLPDPENPGRIKAFTRATTMAKAIADTYNLSEWSKRMVVQGIATKPELLNAVDLMEDDRSLRDSLTGVVEDAMEASGANVRRERGTQLHYFTEAVDSGRVAIEDVPAEYRKEVAAYVAAMQKAGIKIDRNGIERIIKNEAAGVVGTADRFPVIMPNGMRLVADVKSGRDLSYSWGEICMQLAIYANGDAMLEYDEHGRPEWGGMPVVEKHVGLVMHVPVDQGKCTLWIVDLTAGWQAVELAQEVREYRSRRNLARFLEPAAWQTPTEPAPPGQPGESIPEGWDGTTSAMEREQAAYAKADENITPGGTVPVAEDDPWGAVPEDGDDDPHGDAAAFEVTPMDEARREFELVKAKAAEIRATKRRRSKAQIQADERAELVEDGVPTVGVYEGAAEALVLAYGIEDEDNPGEIALDTAGFVAGGEATIAVHNEGTPGGTATVEGAPLSADRKVTQPDGTTMTPSDDANGYVVTPPDKATFDRSAKAFDRIAEVPPLKSEMATLYTEYKDVWTPAHTKAGSDRVAAHAATVHDALDHCQTAADMGTVYKEFAPIAWCDEFTEYGKRQLATPAF